ncbi:MAG: CBS domain-containing protein [Candidatus Omnitrophica bacterium]|nr:CBS domain-containing protein [Candidatus Omnitrophota bacterium]
MGYVRDIMKKEIIAAKASDSVQQISKFLTEKKISNIPIINETGELVGIVSEQDIIRAMESEKFMTMTARDIMTTDIVVVKESDSLEHVAKIFTERPFRRLPVVKDNKVIGIVTRENIIKNFMSDYY